MTVIWKKIYQNLASINAPIGQGAGFLGFVMSQVLYIQCFNKLFEPPKNLGEYHNDILVITSTGHWNELLMQHKTQKQTFDTYKVIIQCLHTQFQAAIHENYLAELNDPDVGLTNVLPSDIHNHMVDWYAKIDLKMAKNNKAKFHEPMNPTKLLVVYTKNKSNAKPLQQRPKAQLPWLTVGASIWALKVS